MRKIALLAWPLFVGGCAATAPRGTWTPVPDTRQPVVQLGRAFVDFRFVDQSGKPGQLSHELGDFTILAFLSGDAGADHFALDELQAMLGMGARNDNVKLVGVVIGSPGAAAEVQEPQGRTWFVTDADGNLHRAYRAASEDWLYVIGPDRTIVLAAPAVQARVLAREFKTQVSELSDERVAAAFEYSD